MKSRKILVIAGAIGGLWSAVEAASQFARLLRLNERSLSSDALTKFPLVDGGAGTIDFLVSNTLGSFLEVETHDATGGGIVAPMGFAGEDGKLAIIEMGRIARVPNVGMPGTTVGVGELIQDALDEGAFSIILGDEEPLARDAGLGAASALGVRFFDADDRELDFQKPDVPISAVARIDATGRSFSLLSARIFIAKSAHNQSAEISDLDEPLRVLAEIIRRDAGIVPSLTPHSASRIEFGLSAFLGAEVRNGPELILEASGISQAIQRGDYTDFVFLGGSFHLPSLELEHLIRDHIPHRAIILMGPKQGERSPTEDRFFYLSDVTLFQAPVDEKSSVEEKRRDASMRLEKLVPEVLESLRSKSSKKAAHA